MLLLHKTQNEVASDTHRFRVLCCGRRWGKTTLAVEEIKGMALARNARIAYIAPTFQQARDIAWQMLVKELKPITKRVNESRLELEVYSRKGESLIVLRGWEAIETLRGQNFDFIVIDEVASMRNFWLHWQEVVRPTLTDTRGQVMFISTPKGFNHFYDLYNVQDTDYISFQFTSYDNPHIPKDEIDKARLELTENRFQQEYLANFKKTEGLVYKSFNRNLHVTTEFPTTYTDTILGIDFGFTNPAAIVPIGVDGDSHYWIREEWYKPGNTVEQLIEQALTYRATKCYPDPASAESVEKCRRAGLNVREVNKDIVAGVDHVRELFKQNRIHIHPDCKNLIYELETYRYPDAKPELNEKEIPVKNDDHALDALRYALFTNKPIIHRSDPTPSYYVA